ncbi:MAG TPA: glycosyltransferase [Thermoleophilaceae bacterium]|nr:glycosyltransferase [Thermoleophilaceae bacterium]
MIRPAVDVVVPFAGSDAVLDDLLRRLQAIELRSGDTVTVVDNRPDAGDRGEHVIAAPEQQSSYHARNRGAARGDAPWLLFIDADVDPAPDILDRYFDPLPDEGVGLLAGGVQDAPLPPDPTRAERYAVTAEQMSQSRTLRAGPWAYAQTANAAVRREAFERIGGFIEGIRSGGDADLCFRLRVAGWRLDSREHAGVVHHNRASTRAFLRQKVRHGAGAAWLNRQYPGSFPPRDRRLWLRRLLRELKTGAQLTARGRTDDAADLLFPTLTVWAFELGRFLPNRVK